MNLAFENIIKATSDLKDNSRNFVIRQLKTISGNINRLVALNESYKGQLNRINPKTYNDNLQKAVDILKMLGFSDIEFVGFSPDFLNWIIEQTVIIKKYNPKLMNFYLLISMQEAYFLTYAEKQGEKPTYKEVRNTMLTFKDQIKEFESDLKLSLPELIKKIDGSN